MTETTIQRVAVLGAGTMGHGIAQISAQAGCDVVLHDVEQSVIERGIGRVRQSLDKLVSKQKITGETRDGALERLKTTTNVAEAVKDAQLVVEAVPERMELKVELFQELGEKAPSEALLATNTSSLSVTEIAGATTHPERVVGMHFFNPVPLMELVELVRGLRTADGTVASARGFAEAIGKQPIVVKDWPGFATSRLGVALGAEAIRMVEQGVAEPEAIDKAMELGYRHPMGPLRLTDLVGLDTRLAIMEHLHREVGEQFRPPTLLRQMVRAGKVGRKAGEGFYQYEQ